MLAAGVTVAHFIDDNNQVWQSTALSNVNVNFSLQFSPVEALKSNVYIQSVSSSNHHLLIDTDGNVYVSGDNVAGQLGLGDTNLVLPQQPIKLENLPHIVAAAAGASHSLLVDINGGVWSFGNNEHCRLAHTEPRVKTVTSPKLIENIPQIQAVSASNHSMFLDYNGEVWGCGTNGHGQLGLSKSAHTVVWHPQKIENIPAIQSIATGPLYTTYLDLNQTAWFSGSNLHSEYTGNSPVMYEPVALANLGKVKSIDASRLPFFLDEDGAVWTANSDLTTTKLQGFTQPIAYQSANVNIHLFADLEHKLWQATKSQDKTNVYNVRPIPNLPAVAAPPEKQLKNARNVI